MYVFAQFLKELPAPVWDEFEVLNFDSSLQNAQALFNKYKNPDYSLGCLSPGEIHCEVQCNIVIPKYSSKNISMYFIPPANMGSKYCFN